MARAHSPAILIVRQLRIIGLADPPDRCDGLAAGFVVGTADATLIAKFVGAPTAMWASTFVRLRPDTLRSSRSVERLLVSTRCGPPCGIA